MPLVTTWCPTRCHFHEKDGYTAKSFACFPRKQGLDPGLFVFSHPGKGISTHGCIGQGFGLQANVVEEYVSLDALLPRGPCILENSGHIVELLRRLRKSQHGRFSRGSAPFRDRPSVPAGELFAFRFIVFQSSVVDNHPIVLKLGILRQHGHAAGHDPVLVLLIVCHFVCIRHGVTCMTRSFECWAGQHRRCENRRLSDLQAAVDCLLAAVNHRPLHEPHGSHRSFPHRHSHSSLRPTVVCPPSQIPTGSNGHTTTGGTVNLDRASADPGVRGCHLPRP